jgi:Mg/Co/Ni transporter MgtE
MQVYAAMSVDEILEAEAAQGNQQAIKLAQELTTNVHLVIELFDLADSTNKYLILREMNERQLQQFLPEMEKDDMLQGLYFFTEDKLMKMLEELPPDQLVKTVFEMFSPEQVVQLMPEEQLDKFLTSTDIDKNKILKHMQSIPAEYVAQVLEQVTGEAVDNLDSIDLSKKFGELNPLEYKDALRAFQPTQKQQLVLSLGKEHSEWFQLFDANAYTKIINREKQQPEVVKAMGVIDTEHIQKMIEELPNDLLSIVITQIDTEKFAYILMNQFPEIMADIILK